MHRHEHPRVIIALSGGTMKIVDQQGKSEEHVWETGKAYWLPTNPPNTMHADVNAGDKPIEVMVVELEKKAINDRRRPGCCIAPRNGPFSAISSSCAPTSTSRAPSSTTMRSAMRTVEKRWDTRIVIPPLAPVTAPGCGGIALEQRVFGLGIERGGGLVQDQQQWLIAHEAARQGQLLPLAER